MDQLLTTADGSHTVFSDRFVAHYHSIHGAIQESQHVFIEAGLLSSWKAHSHFSILEMGFGTGLNALLTHLKAKEFQRKISYTTIEAYPIDLVNAAKLNYCEILGRPEFADIFQNYHRIPTGEIVAIDETFTLTKIIALLEQTVLETEAFDLVYFDAFSPTEQPELWGTTILGKIFMAMKPGGTFVTYCAKGELKRTLKSVGFQVESLPGPPGKREMVRARKV